MMKYRKALLNTIIAEIFMNKDNPFRVVYDYDKKEPKERDIKYTFHTVEVTKEELEKLYPKKDV